MLKLYLIQEKKIQKCMLYHIKNIIRFSLSYIKQKYLSTEKKMKSAKNKNTKNRFKRYDN